ncbi:MAG: hypothetical protein Q7T89_19435, partial [Anaerolineales bacterium]|nr:hypothetical protein [Anaerolineales bacterium]
TACQVFLLTCFQYNLYLQSALIQILREDCAAKPTSRDIFPLENVSVCDLIHFEALDLLHK